MNQKAKQAIIAGLNLMIGATGVVVLSANAHADAALSKQDIQPSRAGDMLQSDTREFESSFLKVSATCKSSHSAFDAVAVAIQNIPADVRAIHAEIERA
jgi:hypothetical protein